MAVAIADAFRNIRVIQPTVPEASITTVAAEVVGDTLSITAGLGITITADPETDTLVISNTGNGTGAYTEISDTNSNSTFYPLFSRPFEPTDINPLDVPPSYQLDAIYVDNTTNPMTYNPSSGTLSFVNASVTTSTISTHEFVGSAANLTRFPSAIVSVSNNGSGVSETTTNIGIIAEGLGTNAGNYGVGVYGVGYTAGNARGTGVTGEAHVTASSDTSSAIGVRGYSNDTHVSGLNVGLFADASGSSLGNYALYVNAGDINTTNVSPIWFLRDNQSTSLSFDSAGKTGILLIKTTDAAEGVTMSGTLSVTGHVTLEGVTSTGSTGSGNLVFSASPTFTGTVSGITATMVGLGNVTNESKSTMFSSPTFTGTVSGVTATMVGLGNVTNESKATMFSSPTFTGTVSGVTATMVGLGNVTNESKATMFSSPTFTGTVSGITPTMVGLGNVENTALSSSTHYIGTTSITYNRASASQTLTGVSIDGNAGTVTDGFYTSSSFNLGTTSIAVNRSSASQSLTGISIDGSAGSTTAAVTFNTTGGAAAGTTFNGSTARTIDYSSVGAAPAAGNSSITTVGTLGSLTVTNNISTTAGMFSSPLATKTSTSAGTAGQIAWDANYIYICTATNTWKRVALTAGVF